MDKRPEQAPTIEKKPAQLHIQAEHAREAGDFTGAFLLAEQASVLYQKEGKLAQAAEAMCSAVISTRHLHENNPDRGFIVRATRMAETALELAKASKVAQALAVPYFNLAKCREEYGNLESAVKNYDNADKFMTLSPPPDHDRPAVKINYHLSYLIARYKLGDESVLGDIDQGLIDLNETKENEYTHDVWLSGAHMDLAAAQRDRNISSARRHLRMARYIIDGNPNLVLRRNQWERLAYTFPQKRTEAA